MKARTPKYHKTHFQHKDITKISGPVIWENLHVVILQLKRNVQTAHINLGGGTHGYLTFFVLDPAVYIPSSTCPPSYAWRLHPIPFAHEWLLTGASCHTTGSLKEAHVDNLRVFNECEGIEKASSKSWLKQLIPPHTSRQQALHNMTTGAYKGTSFNMIHNLCFTYGHMT